jgi:hypothetical protein
MPKQNNHALGLLRDIRLFLSRKVGFLALSAALCSGMALGIIYAQRYPVEVTINGTCEVKFPEFLIPSSS